MSSERTAAFARAIVTLAEAEGALDTVEDELLEVGRAVDGSDDLRDRLTDLHLPLARRLGFVESEALVAAHPVTRTALAMVIAGGAASHLSAIATAVAEAGAASRDQEFVEVRVAQPLDEARRSALKAALERSVGRPLDLKVIVDPSVVGGVSARIGDTVIDGTVSRRLEELRARIGA
jgi:F-type H+-transporting ATPase subunit delta